MPEETPGKGLSPGKVIFPCRHFDQVKRVEKSPKAKQYHNYSYHKQGDLSTSLEMTFPFLVVIQSEAMNPLERSFFLVVISTK